MKKMILLAGIILCAAVLFAGCGSGDSDKDQAQTPEQAVREYFAYWGNRDKDSMDRLILEEQRTEEDDPDISLVTSLKLNSCMAVADELREEWDPQLYPDPYDFAYVDVDFDIAFEGGEGAGYTDGNYQSRFYLIKENKTDSWKIVMWGLG